ncbi:SDR family NAD(P)-dependent oxidoreductase [Paenibacillus sp. J2TS4]|uniref:SDR family NAD(P)-dependent oxidoreductase n=1 Tax=Paenibacillus sp. J2TS4 TaxID=2807194 RepID=UPI001B085A1A|nr:SDR family oxidoreductase [Paenibacillus sp. J2TS4]GIP31619.1 3-hydroxybutyrate dehydrogenase [Paenibacillus sp. J2TS4]
MMIKPEKDTSTQQEGLARSAGESLPSLETLRSSRSSNLSRMTFDMSDRVAVVTGAGSGIGRAVAQALLEAGARVACWDIAENEEIGKGEELFGGRVMALKVDVSEEASVKLAVEQTLEKFGQADLVVNCAGIMYKSPLEDIDIKVWDKMYAVNVNGTLLVNKHLAPFLKKSRCGRIVNISSMTALIGLETYLPYSTGKAAVSSMTKIMAAELAPYGITVNALCPGWVDTPWLDKLIWKIASLHDCDFRTAEQMLLEHIPQQRYIHPDEIAFSVLFLAHPLAQGISGTDFVIDNGLTATFKPGLHLPYPNVTKRVLE